MVKRCYILKISILMNISKQEIFVNNRKRLLDNADIN